MSEIQAGKGKPLKGLRACGIMLWNAVMLHIIFYTILVILVLSFFGVSVESVVHSPEAQTNFAYVWGFVLVGWHYIQGLYNVFIMWLGGIVH